MDNIELDHHDINAANVLIMLRSLITAKCEDCDNIIPIKSIRCALCARNHVVSKLRARAWRPLQPQPADSNNQASPTSKIES